MLKLCLQTFKNNKKFENFVYKHSKTIKNVKT